MKKIILTLFIVLAVQGCSVSFTGGVAADAFYPNMTTAKGGSFGDPDTSRREATRPTTSHMRNNDSTSAWLSKFFDTSPRPK